MNEVRPMTFQKTGHLFSRHCGTQCYFSFDPGLVSRRNRRLSRHDPHQTSNPADRDAGNLNVETRMVEFLSSEAVLASASDSFHNPRKNYLGDQSVLQTEALHFPIKKNKTRNKGEKLPAGVLVLYPPSGLSRAFVNSPP